MYHVANLIPHNPKDAQQLERKRHIGNDIVVIAYCDEMNAIDSITVFRSHQNRTEKQRERGGLAPLMGWFLTAGSFVDVLVLVTPVGEQHYYIRVIAKEAVPAFRPSVPESGALIKVDEHFCEAFTTLLVNAERASYCAPVFASRITRTRASLVKDLVDTHSAYGPKVKPS